jgi:hypothetical protein
MVRKKSKIRMAVESVVRVVVVTAVFTLLSFAIGLFCGITSTVLYGFIRHVHPDMTWAYKFVAAPFGVMGMIITFFTMVVTEIRRALRPLELSQPAARTL